MHAAVMIPIVSDVIQCRVLGPGCEGSRRLEERGHDAPLPARRCARLGEHGSWEAECREKGIIRLWFGTANDERFIALCRARQWDRLTELFRAEGKSKGTATRFTNEKRLFFGDDGTTLWITFMGGRLWWGFLTSAAAEPHSDGGVWRKVAGGWRQTDRAGERLTNDRLSGAVTKYAAYRGTSCRVDVADYVVRRINALKVPPVAGAIAPLQHMHRP